MATLIFNNLDDLSAVASLLPPEGVSCYPNSSPGTGEPDGTHTLVVPDAVQDQAEALAGDIPTARKSVLSQYARAVSWQKRIGGVPVGGILVATDAEGLTLVNGLKAMAEDQPDRIFSYDSPAGPIPLTAGESINLARAVGNFVQSTFDRRAEVLAKIDAGEIASKAEVDAAFADL